MCDYYGSPTFSVQVSVFTSQLKQRES
jgi:hypothetical protein